MTSDRLATVFSFMAFLPKKDLGQRGLESGSAPWGLAPKPPGFPKAWTRKIIFYSIAFLLQ